MSEEKKDERTLRCATCREAIATRVTNAHFPFCSERCRMEDLGNWLNESYRIPIGHGTTERSLPGEYEQ